MIEGWHESGLFFTSSIGTPINPGNLARAYKASQRSAGVPGIRFHDLRHTAASLSIRRGDSAKIVSDRLGYTDVVFTMNTYVHLFAEQGREGAFGIADLQEDEEGSNPTNEDEAGEQSGSSEDEEAQEE